MFLESILTVNSLSFQSMNTYYLITSNHCFYSTSGQSGMFSTDGIIQSDTTNNSFVQCSTTHLTSFAVLVDVSGVSVMVR